MLVLASLGLLYLPDFSHAIRTRSHAESSSCPLEQCVFAKLASESAADTVVLSVSGQTLCSWSSMPALFVNHCWFVE